MNKRGQALLMQSVVAVLISAVLIGGLISVFVAGAHFYRFHNAYLQASLAAERAVDLLSSAIRWADKDSLLLNTGQETPSDPTDDFILVYYDSIGLDSSGNTILGVKLADGTEKVGWRICYGNDSYTMGLPSHRDLLKIIQFKLGGMWVNAIDPNVLEDEKIYSIADVDVVVVGYQIDQSGAFSTTNKRPDFVVIKATAFRKMGNNEVSVTKTMAVELRN